MANEKNIITELNFKNTNLSQIERSIFDGLRCLTRICFSSNRIKKIDAGLFKGLENLMFIDLSTNQITHLDPDIFNGLNELRTIIFCENRIARIDRSLFNGLKKLECIDFSSNQLTNLDVDIFNGLENLIQINFSNNNLVHVSSSIFKNLHNLKAIYFNSNPMTHIGSSVFNNLKKLTFIDFTSDYECMTNFHVFDYKYLFYLFFCVDSHQYYLHDKEHSKLSFKTNKAWFYEYVNMCCLSRNKITIKRDECLLFDLKEFFSSDVNFKQYYRDDFTPIDFMLTIKSISNKTLVSLLQYGNHIIDSYKFKIQETDFMIKHVDSVRYLCRRNSQKLLDIIGNFFGLQNFCLCKSIVIEENNEAMACCLWDIFLERVIEYNDDEQEMVLRRFNLSINNYLHVCSKKQWWMFYQKLLDFTHNHKLKFYLMFEKNFYPDSSNNIDIISDTELDTLSESSTNLVWETIENASSNHLLYYVVSSKQSKLIQHETTTEFLELKWKHLPRMVYHFHLWLYIVFVISYTINLECLNEQESLVYTISLYVALVTVCILLFEEIVQILISGLLHVDREYKKCTFVQSSIYSYSNSFPNMLEIIVYPSCLASLLITSLELKLYIYSFVILFVYAILILRLEKFKVIGIYVTVFKNILRRSIKVVPLILFVSLAFLFSFRISSLKETGDEEKLFNGSIALSFIRLMTLNLGNYENHKMGLDTDIGISNWPEYVIYTVFLFIIPILIINIFIGISVDEMRKLIDYSHVHNIIIRTEYTLRMQDALSGINRFFTRIPLVRLINGKFKNFITWSVSINMTKINKIVNNRGKNKNPITGKKKNKIVMDEDSQQMSKLEEKVDILQQTMKEMSNDVEKLEQRMISLSNDFKRLYFEHKDQSSRLINYLQNLESQLDRDKYINMPKRYTTTV